MTQAFNLALLANKVNSSGQLDASTGLYNLPIPSGSVFLLYQASAPTGWTQVTTLNDYALRIVSSAGGGTGGTTAFSTVFANQTPSITISGITIGATTLSSTQIGSHTHNTFIGWGPGGCYASGEGLGPWGQPGFNAQNRISDASGGGASHTHSVSGSTGSSSAITLNVRYANIILCSKN